MVFPAFPDTAMCHRRLFRHHSIRRSETAATGILSRRRVEEAVGSITEGAHLALRRRIAEVVSERADAGGVLRRAGDAHFVHF